MKHMLDKLAGKDDAENDDHAEAKMQVLHELRDMPHEMHGVEVMAPDQEGLHKGLDLAQHVMSQQPEHSIDNDLHSSHGQPDRSNALHPEAKLGPDREENPGEDEDDMDDDELDSMIAELQAKKASRDPRMQK